MAKWIERQNNPLYPLPTDYEELSKEGQRLSRTNACRLWTSQDRSQMDIAEAFVAGMRFFDLYYLTANHNIDFDPMFYDDDPLRTPDFHYDIQRLWATTPRNIVIAPRGSAKSFLVRKSILFRMLSRSAYSILYAPSTNDNAKGTGQAIKDQFINNSRIWDDFSPDFPDGRLAPRRGEAPFGTELMHLKNGSWLRCISAESRQRGGRPRRYVLDDPEYDPRASTSMSIIRGYMDDLLFKIVLPMVMRRGCGVDWLATFVSRRHYAWHALQTEQNAEGENVAIDPRFNMWGRMIVRAAHEGSDGQLVSCWPEMWPPTKQFKKENPEYSDRVSLEEIREIIGSANFLAEYMASPGQSEDSYFPALTKEKHGWWLEKVDEEFELNPRGSQTFMCWYSESDLQRIPMEEFLKRTRLFMTLDTSYTATRDSDYKVACLMGINSKNELFILDVWSKQCQEQTLVQEAFKLADRWKCPTMHPETIKQGIGLYHALDSIVRTRASDMAGVTHLPGVKKLNPGQLDKSSKIATLLMRMEHGKIKMPLSYRHRSEWGRLFDQFEQFNPEAKDGGLQHDDEIDCVAMSQFVVKGRLRSLQRQEAKGRDPVEEIKKGNLIDEDGNPYIHGINFNSLHPSDIMGILDRHNEGTTDGQSRV